MDGYKERVILEKEQLDEKIKKLNDFFTTEIYAKLPDNESTLLSKQQRAMMQYSEILKQRVALWGIKS